MKKQLCALLLIAPLAQASYNKKASYNKYSNYDLMSFLDKDTNFDLSDFLKQGYNKNLKKKYYNIFAASLFPKYQDEIVCISPNMNYAVAVTIYGEALLLDTTSKKQTVTNLNCDFKYSEISFSPDSKFVIMSSNIETFMIELSTLKTIRYKGRFNTMSENGKFMLTDDGYDISLIEVKTAKVIKNFSANKLLFVDFVKNKLALGYHFKDVKLFDLSEFETYDAPAIAAANAQPAASANTNVGSGGSGTVNAAVGAHLAASANAGVAAHAAAQIAAATEIANEKPTTHAENAGSFAAIKNIVANNYIETPDFNF